MLTTLTARQAALLAAIWFAGLYTHSFVQTAALPGLSRRRALTLNLAGSAVSNVVPFGGAFGTGLNYAMTRSWGVSRPAFALYTIVTNLWNVLAKLALPACALLLLVLTGDAAGPRLVAAAAGAAVALVVVCVGMVATLRSEQTARRIGLAVQAVIGLLLAAVRSPRRVRLEGAAAEMRRSAAGLLSRVWGQLTLGMLGYCALQALLLWSSVHLFGDTLTPAEMLAGYALERILTLAPITPGGAGLAEVGVTALLVSFGGDPAATAAGVLLYRGFIFGLEIPVGGAALLVWMMRRRRPGLPRLPWRRPGGLRPPRSDVPERAA